MIFIIIIILIIIIKVRDSRPAPWERGAKEWGPWTGLLHHHDHHHHHPSSSSSLSSSTSSPLCWRHHCKFVPFGLFCPKFRPNWKLPYNLKHQQKMKTIFAIHLQSGFQCGFNIFLWPAGCSSSSTWKTKLWSVRLQTYFLNHHEG